MLIANYSDYYEKLTINLEEYCLKFKQCPNSCNNTDEISKLDKQKTQSIGQ